MSNKVAFTICAKNYLGLAQLLETSFRKHNEGIDFFIFVADEYSQEVSIDLPENVLISRNVLAFTPEKWNELSFKYTLVEFCTAIKPFCFKYLVEKGDYSKIVFLDPDILVFDSFQSIFDNLHNNDIILTPHTLTIQEDYTGDFAENLFLGVGGFNLGFIAIRKCENSLKMLNWWCNRLIDKCFTDIYDYITTDQKWMALLPSYFDQNSLHISHNLGYNIAPWNFFEREVIEKEGKFYVRNRILSDSKTYPIVFVHFSKYDYLELKKGIVKHYGLVHEYEDLEVLFDFYVKEIKTSNIEKYIDLKYSYDYFDNDYKISLLNRRFYRRLVSEKVELGNPFGVEEGSYFLKLKDKKLLSKSATHHYGRANHIFENNDSKKRSINFILRMIKMFIGIDRFCSLINWTTKLCRIENQLFLYDKKYFYKFRN